MTFCQFLIPVSESQFCIFTPKQSIVLHNYTTDSLFSLFISVWFPSSACRDWQWRRGRFQSPRRGMAILQQADSHSPRLWTAIRPESDGYSSADKWLFSSGPMAIGLRMLLFSLFPLSVLSPIKSHFSDTEIPQFGELYILHDSHCQRLIFFLRFKIRVFAIKIFFGQKYATLAAQIYNLTKW